ncbi:hotdog fold thioesterase [Arsenicicoccus piscis]|uniref:hotdog fold thioesterase n=1 Tax=Arsenicicoccus piscis TaxID=673954 RepID=UPI001F4C66EB|nr:hotdog fold thioesterase [Arsenicicoccus piscis]MCH8626789.1 hotdog fold thioesterase [Arsenicicoccus piscis]
MTDTPPTEVPIEVLRESGRGTLLERMGIELTSATKDRVTGTMPVSGNTQPYGLLHGGASVVLAETLGSYAAMLNAGEGRIAVGVDINATHHRSLREGVVRGVATPVHVGRSTACFDVVVTDEQDRRVCTSRITCALLDAPR